MGGPPGVGKTHLAYAVVNALLELGQQALVIREVDLFAELGARYGPDPGRAAEGERLLSGPSGGPTCFSSTTSVRRSPRNRGRRPGT